MSYNAHVPLRVPTRRPVHTFWSAVIRSRP